MTHLRRITAFLIPATCIMAAARIDTSADQALLDAIRQGNVAAVNRLFGQGASATPKMPKAPPPSCRPPYIRPPNA